MSQNIHFIHMISVHSISVKDEIIVGLIQIWKYVKDKNKVSINENKIIL